MATVQQFSYIILTIKYGYIIFKFEYQNSEKINR